MNSAGDIITDLVFLVMAFGLEVVAILMLVWSGIFARSLGVVITPESLRRCWTAEECQYPER